MAETYEKLGIQIELDFSKLTPQLAVLTRNLNQALKADAFKQIVDVIKGMETGTAKASDALNRVTKKQQDYAKAAGASAEEIKKLDKAVTAYMRAQKFADGGLVGGGYTRAGSKKEDTADPGDLTLNIINVVDPRSIPKTTGQEILNVISYEAAKDGPTFKQWKAKIAGHG